MEVAFLDSGYQTHQARQSKIVLLSKTKDNGKTTKQNTHLRKAKGAARRRGAAGPSQQEVDHLGDGGPELLLLQLLAVRIARFTFGTVMMGFKLLLLVQHSSKKLIEGCTRPSVNYAKDWLDHSFLALVWSGKGFHFGSDH